MTGAIGSMTPILFTAIEQHLREKPDQECLRVTVKGRQYTYTTSELFVAISKVSAYLAASQIDPGAVAFAFIPTHPLAQAVFVGLMKGGLIPAFMPCPSAKQDSKLFWDAHHELFRKVRPPLTIGHGYAEAHLRTLVDEVGGRYVDIDELMGDLNDDVRPSTVALNPESAALLQHSSGTTGLKKGVVLTYRDIAEQVRAYAPVAGVDASSRIVSWLPLYHDMGLFTALLMPLSVGAFVSILDPFEWVARPESLLEVIEKERATHVWLPNFAFRHLATAVPKKGSWDLSSVKSWISCSEPVKPSALAEFVRRFEACGVTRARLQACYAMAETSFAVSQSAFDQPPRTLAVDDAAFRARKVQLASAGEPSRTFVSNGRPLPGFLLDIRCDAEADVGEVLIKGPSLFSGYYRNDDATDAAFLEGWYRTGDLGFVHDGEVFITGREKDILIVHGSNFYAHDIEESRVDFARDRAGPSSCDRCRRSGQ